MMKYVGLFWLFWMISGSLYGQIFKGGILTEDEFWESRATPYIVTENLIIPVGKRLYIGPDVKVRFINNSSLILWGELVVEGQAESVSFLSPDLILGGFEARWSGIQLKGDSARLRLEYTALLYAQTALNLQGSTHSQVDIRHSVFSNNDRALLLSKADFIHIEENLFLDNELPVELSASTTSFFFQHNTICSNGRFLIFVNYAAQNPLSFQNNCWCGQSPRELASYIWDQRQVPELPPVHIFPEAGSNCEINDLGQFLLGGGDVTVVLDDFVGTENEEEISRWLEPQILPHPLRDVSEIVLRNWPYGSVSMKIYNLHGQIIQSHKILLPEKLYIRRTDFQAGMYLMSLQGPNQSWKGVFWVE